MTRTLVVTNDFPPRAGGIQGFVQELADRQPRESVVVYAPAWPGAVEHDAELPYPVVRHPSSLMLPVPGVARRAADIARAEGCTAVLFGAAFPLGLTAPALRKAGVERVVGLTHGHEAGWARIAGARAALRRIGETVDVLTYLGEYTKARLTRALSSRAARHMVWLPPGVDHTRFHPGAGGDIVRKRYGLVDRPVVVCVSRLVPRKGQDTLIRAWPSVLRRIPDAALLLVSAGPYHGRLERLAGSVGVSSSVRFTGAPSWDDTPAYFDAGDVFAMPCRTRLGGLDVEGLGIVYLEAMATGLPVLAGDSGGAPEAVRHGETGYVVDGRSVTQVADRLVELLSDPGRARALGTAGRAWVEREWRWDIMAAKLRNLLTGHDQR